MATWSKVYSRVNWVNKPSTATPLNASNLNSNDYALDVIDSRVVELRGMLDNIGEYLPDLEEAVAKANSWADGQTSGGYGTATNNAKYWAQVAQEAAEESLFNLGEAGYLGFVIDDRGHLIMTKSTVLAYLDFALQDHKDLVYTVTSDS